MKTEAHKIFASKSSTQTKTDASPAKPVQNVKVMKVTKLPNGKLLCVLCKKIFEAINDVVQHMPNCTNLENAEDIKERPDVLKNLSSNQRAMIGKPKVGLFLEKSKLFFALTNLLYQ